MVRTPGSRFHLRGLVTLLALLALLATSSAGALAQDASPEASPEASPVATGGGGGPVLGDAVVLFDTRGNEVAQIAVVDVVDPYEDVESDSARGSHYVAVEVVAQNLTDELFAVDTYSIRLVDGEGGLYTSTFVSRSEESTAETPDLATDELEAEDTTSGLLFFEVPDGATAASVVFTNAYETFTLLADLRESVPAEDEATTIYDEQGEEIGAITLDEALPALEDTSDSFDVDRGETVLGAVLTVENTGDAPLTADLYSMYVVDEFGYLYSATSFFREEEEIEELPDLTTEEIEEGEEASGLVAFTLPNDAQPAYILYIPAGSQLFVVAQLGEGSVVSGDELTPVSPDDGEDTDGTDDAEGTPDTEDSDDVGLGPDPSDETGSDEEGTASAAECAEIEPWAEATAENLAFFDDLPIDDLETVTVAQLRDAAEVIGDAAETQAGIDAPGLAADYNDAFVTYLEEFAAVLEDGADEVEGGTDAADVFTEELFAEDTELGAALQSVTDATSELATACPDIEYGF